MTEALSKKPASEYIATAIKAPYFLLRSGPSTYCSIGGTASGLRVGSIPPSSDSMGVARVTCRPGG